MTAEFKQPQMDTFRIIVPEDLEQEVIGRFHKASQRGHFSTSILANKVLNHFWMSTPIVTVTRYIKQWFECKLKKKGIIHKIKP